MKHIKKIFEDKNSEKEAEELKHAKEYDLITLPKDITGTNCGNCKFINDDKTYCQNKHIDQKVNPKMCCALWDAEGVIRSWDK